MQQRSSGSVGAGMLMPLRKRMTYHASGALAKKKEIFNTTPKKLDTPVEGCEI